MNDYFNQDRNTITAYLGNDDMKPIIESGAKFHHRGTFSGYVSRKLKFELYAYKGRFGTGFVAARPNYYSTTYCYFDYYIIPEK